MFAFFSSWRRLINLGSPPSQGRPRRADRPKAARPSLRVEALEGRVLLSLAPDFNLPSTAGGMTALSGFRGRSNVLLYLNEGLTWAPCIQQLAGMPESLENKLSEFQSLNVTLLGVMVDPVDGLQAEAQRSGIRTPLLSYQNARTEVDYDLLRFTMMPEQRRAGHTFVLVGTDGTIKWRKDYWPGVGHNVPGGQMLVPAQEILTEVRAALSAVLTVAVDVSEVSEAAGARAVQATVSRRGVTTSALEVTLTSSRTGDVPSPARVTIPAGVERVSVPLDLIDNTQADGTRGVTLTATAAGFQPATATFKVLDNEGLRGLFLSQATYTGVEGSGGVRITVVRGSQDAGTGVTVTYATGDGTAKSGADYTAASGTLTFAAGEVSKSYTVALADDGLAKANRAFTVSLSNPGGGLPLLTPSRATVAISDNDLPAVADSARTDSIGRAADAFAHSRELYTNFVTKAYQTYLKRGPDPAGLNGWVEAMLARRVTDETLEAGFLASPEYIQKNGGQGRGWVVGMYQDLLGRTPSEAEVNAWLNAMSQGRTEYQVALGFAASPEREGQRVRENYRVYLERSPSQAEVDAYVAEFVSGRMTNEDVIARFLGSPEYYTSRQRGQGNRAAWLAMAYEQVLFRHPSRAEVDGWLRSLG